MLRMRSVRSGANEEPSASAAWQVAHCAWNTRQPMYVATSVRQPCDVQSMRGGAVAGCAAAAPTASAAPQSSTREPRRLTRDPSSSVMDDRADALAVMHEVERLVDVLEPHRVRDHFVDLD